MSQTRDRWTTGGALLVVALLAAGPGGLIGDGSAAGAAAPAAVVGAEVDCSRRESPDQYADADVKVDESVVRLTCQLAIAASFAGFGGDGDGSVGDTAHFNYTVTNEGSASLKNVVVTDEAETALSCRTETGAEVTSDTVLEADDPTTADDDNHEVVCAAEHTVSQADVDRGSVVREATVTADDGTGDAEHRATATVSTKAGTAAAAPLMTVAGEKPVVDMTAAGPDDRVDAGDTVSYSFTVTNTGNVTLSGVSVGAPKVGGVTCPKTTLAPKATTTCVAAAVVLSQAQVDAGELAVEATVTVSLPQGASVTGAAGKAVLAAAPAATLVKSVRAKPPVKAGGKVSYSFKAANAGNVTLTGLSVSDPKAGKVTCPKTTLAPKATTTCVATYSATPAEIEADLIENTATVTATAPGGKTVAASDSVSFSPGTGKTIANRLAGKDRYSTAVEISKATFAPRVGTAYIATGANFPDALAGSAASGGMGPILLVMRDSIPGATLNELRRLKPKHIVVLGGEGVVSMTVKVKLSAYGKTTRQAGSDRYATAAEISAAHFDPGAPVAYVATGADFPDALTGGPSAAELGGPILLTQKDKLPSATIGELRRLKPKSIVVLGGTGVVSAAVAKALRGHTSGKVSRLAGAHRYSTGAAISKAAFDPGVAVVYVATGADFPDALAGGAAGGLRDGPVLLVSGSTIPEATMAELTRLKPKKVIVLGGAAVVPRSVRQALGAYLSGTTHR